jgi:peptide/nickel transport system ATP-binding protein
VTAEALLAVGDLSTHFELAGRTVRAVDGVSFEVAAGEKVAIVGESGSGKSVTALSLLGLVDPPGRIVKGDVSLDGTSLTAMDERGLVKVRGRRVAIIFQDAQGALNPLRTIGSQLQEALRIHGVRDKRAARARALGLLEQVGLGDPELRLRQYPHELSGGMNQRVMIAIALAGEPELLIADEPTTALDATTEAGVLDVLRQLTTSRGLAVLMISHDLGTVAAFADRVLIMYAGRVVEQGDDETIFYRSRHPYTRGLLASVPGEQRGLVPAMPGSVPDLAAGGAGCLFQPRCPIGRGDARCATQRPPLDALGDDGQRSACWHAEALDGSDEWAVPSAAAAPRAEDDAPEVLRVERLSKHFKIARTLFGGHGGTIHAVNDVSFTLRRGETLALVGESGSGKTTTARVLLGLEPATSGSVTFAGRELVGADPRTMRALRRELQVVFQSPDNAIDPKLRVFDVVAQPLVAHRIGTDGERHARVRDLLVRVGLQADDERRYAYEFSGGQKQRLSIARALATEPAVVVCDEPVTALDVSVQAQILNLLYELQADQRVAYLLIAHDLSMVRQTADRIAVMYLGRIVEHSTADRFFSGPAHPYSAALLSARRTPDPRVERAREPVILPGTAPSAMDPPSGCSFHTRCPKAQPVCRSTAPATRLLGSVEVACHFPLLEH